MRGSYLHNSFVPAAQPATLCDIVHQRALVDGDSVAYTFLADAAADARSITWSQLNHRAAALGALLHQQGATGERVLLALPSGLSFIESLFACWHAGAIAVPVSLPRHQRVKHRLDGILADADAKFAIGAADTHQRLEGGAAAALTWIDPNTAGDAICATASAHAINQRVALLQYTSGSTGVPNGVIITHTNLMHNSALIAEACGNGPGQTIACWLPLFHDMGLVGFVLQAAYSGARLVFMSPERFLMRPWLWLQMISDYSARGTSAPNFAYDLCVDRIMREQKATLNLSGWQYALSGSEPVRAATLDRFANAFASCGFQPRAFFPCYGLAEATLFVTGSSEIRPSTRRTAEGKLLAQNDAGGHVGCGQPFGDTQLRIVDQQTMQPVPPGAVGEIWVAGKSVAEGYWKNPEATEATFNGRLEGSDQAWLRTGDLGFIAGTELFITGRLRELIIIAGRNHFPIDLERTVESADPAIAPLGAAAFSVDIGGVERLIIAAEIRREYGRAKTESPVKLDCETVRRNVRAAIATENEVFPQEIVLLRPGALPRTTSGKVRRRATREAYLNHTLELLGN